MEKKKIIGDLYIKGNLIVNKEVYDSVELMQRIEKMYAVLNKEIVVKENTTIAIAQNRGVDYVVADLMALKYGITFLNLDLSLPSERILYMVNDAEVSAVICSSDCSQEFGVINKVVIDDYLSCEEMKEIKEKEKNEVAYILYTSGTTGRPKGVEVRREGLYWFIKDVPKCVDFSKTKTIGGFTNQTFDINYLEIFMGLLIGLDVVLGDDNDIINPKKMLSLINKNNIDVLQLTPSKFKLIQTVDKECNFLNNIKVLMIGGEQFPKNLLEDINKLYNGKIYNMYGPTETTIWSTIADLTGKKEVIIGQPLENTTVYIVDECKKILQNGEQGEIAIGGKGLAKGYKNKQELTDEKFITLDNDEKVYLTGDVGFYNNEGQLECLGRVDSQVKINGHRIELDEIDALISKMDNIEISLTCFENVDNKMYTFYCSNNEIEREEFVTYLEKYVPEYMIPNRFIKVDGIKYTASGKSDRKAMLNDLVKEYEVKQVIEQDIQDEIQEEIIKIIVEMGELSEDVHMNTSIGDLGLDSIEFVNIVVETEELYDIEFDDENMLIETYKTVKDFVDYVKMKKEELDG